MKIQSLIEAKFSKPTYAYHATAIEHLRSIIKSGLMPNFKEGGYGSEEQSHVGYSLSPLKGVYFTRSGKEAEEISKVLESPSGLGAVLICKIQPQQAELDEDRLTSSVINEREFALLVRRKLKEEGEDFEDEESFHNMGAQLDDFISTYINKSIAPNVTAIAGSKVSQHAVPFIHAYLRHVVEFIMDTVYGGPEHEHELKQAQNELTKQLRRLARAAHQTHHTFKVDAKIGFSGANKIVGVYFPLDGVGWGDLGYFEGAAYHKYQTPVQLYRSVIAKYLIKKD